MAFEGRHKLVDKWSEDVYVIHKQVKEDVPVFVVRREDGQGKHRTLHRNLLLPIGSLHEEGPVENQEIDVPRPLPRARATRPSGSGLKPIPPPRGRPIPAPRRRIERLESSDSEEEDYFILPPVTEHNVAADFVEGSVVSEEVLPAQPDDDLGSVQEGSGSGACGDAHTSEVEEEAEDPEVEDEEERAEEQPAQVAEDSDEREGPRRSGRATRKPQWQTSGTFHMSQQSPHRTVPWREKATLLKVLLEDGSLAGMSDTFSTAVVSAILNN